MPLAKMCQYYFSFIAHFCEVQGVINIIGYIGSFVGPDGVEIKGVELIDVISQVQAQENADSFLVKINSKGGVCSVGYDIYDYLKTLGKPIYTEATNYCCSMATIIMMAGETREAVEPLEFLPHNPWTDGVKGDADAIAQAAEEMRAEEDKMIAFYSKATGISKEGIDAIMKLDKAIPLEKAVELKFLTGIKKSQLKAVAVLKNTKSMADNKIILDLKKGMDKLMKALKIGEPKSMKATTTDGKEVEFLDANGNDFSGYPVPGDMAMMGGQPAPDGTYTFADYSVNVLMGAVTEVIPSDAALEAQKQAKAKKEEEERKAALTKDADELLKKENEELKKENKELKEFSEALAVKIEGLDKAISTIRSTYEAPDEKTGFRKGTKDQVLDLKKEAEEARKRYKK